MSLSRLALRIATVRMLENATSAADMVYDSRILPLAETTPRDPSERRPVIVVLTENDDRGGEPRQINAGARKLDLTIEIIIASYSEIPDGEGGTLLSLDFAETDPGIEFMLDLVEAEVVNVLQAGQGPWSELWRRIVTKRMDYASHRTADANNGVRYAARQIVYTVDTIADPPFGTPVAGTIWADFIAAMQADPTLSVYAGLLRTRMEAPALLDWQVAQASLGLTLAEVRAIGLAPIFEPTTDPNDVQEAPPVIEMTAGDLVSNEEIIGEALPPEADDGP